MARGRLVEAELATLRANNPDLGEAALLKSRDARKLSLPVKALGSVKNYWEYVLTHTKECFHACVNVKSVSRLSTDVASGSWSIGWSVILLRPYRCTTGRDVPLLNPMLLTSAPELCTPQLAHEVLHAGAARAATWQGGILVSGKKASCRRASPTFEAAAPSGQSWCWLEICYMI